MEIKISPAVTVTANNTSCWEQSDKSYKINKVVLIYYDFNDRYGSIDVYGPSIKDWYQYTDRQIEKQIRKLDPFIERATGLKVKSIDWSEQGKQPDKGWNFSVSFKKSR